MSASTVKSPHSKDVLDERDSERMLLKESLVPGKVDNLENSECQGTKIGVKRCKLLEEDTQPLKKFKQDDLNQDDYVLSRIISNLHKPLRQKAYQNSLMLSEWLLKVPEDFEENWIMIPCPPGKRVLIVAAMGATKCYSKSGEFKFFFQSALPGGHSVASDESHNSLTILDCLWHHANKTYYVLDVLAWNTCHFVYCEAMFRFLWLQQKIYELGSSLDVSENNHYRFSFLPRVPCKKDEMVPTMSSSFLVTEFSGIDGILFYNGSAPYFSGVSSTVGWLKPFMIPEVFAIPASPVLFADCPDDYVDAKQYIREFEYKRRRVTKKEKAIRSRRQAKKLFVGSIREGIVKIDEIVPKKE